MPEINQFLVPLERIESYIYFIRGKRVMLDRDLAALYDVSTKTLNQAVKRNKKRFPEDFMFQLDRDETELHQAQNLRSQFVTSSLRSQNGTPSWGGTRYLPLAFTEQGVAMLSSVLNSERAIMVNIQIIRTFTKLREMVASHEDLKLKLEALEKRYDENFKAVFDALRKLLEDDEMPKPQIGFTLK
ncbi:MAG: ORF6N domain-containing protein [Patescibacteria group bacterium]